MYYALRYPETENGWIAKLGASSEQKFDTLTGKEDFTEHRQIRTRFEEWQPGLPWTPPPVSLHFEARGRACNKTDRLFHGLVGPMISLNAVEKLRPLLEREGHILPLHIVNSDERFYLWWVPWVENSVDLERSEKFPNGTTVKRYSLNKDRVKGLTALRTHYEGIYNPDGQGEVLVSDEFRQAWLGVGLTGIKFI